MDCTTAQFSIVATGFCISWLLANPMAFQATGMPKSPTENNGVIKGAEPAEGNFTGSSGRKAIIPPSIPRKHHPFPTTFTSVSFERMKRSSRRMRTFLAILKWRQTILSKTSRWYPILQRYITYIEGRILGMGGDPAKILPSPLGTANQPIGQRGLPILHPVHPDEHKFVGKVEAVIYDRFGDFEGF